MWKEPKEPIIKEEVVQEKTVEEPTQETEKEEEDLKEKKEITVNDLLLNHEQRIVQMEAKWFRLGGI